MNVIVLIDHNQHSFICNFLAIVSLRMVAVCCFRRNRIWSLGLGSSLRIQMSALTRRSCSIYVINSGCPTVLPGPHTTSARLVFFFCWNPPFPPPPPNSHRPRTAFVILGSFPCAPLIPPRNVMNYIIVAFCDSPLSPPTTCSFFFTMDQASRPLPCPRSLHFRPTYHRLSYQRAVLLAAVFVCHIFQKAHTIVDLFSVVMFRESQ